MMPLPPFPRLPLAALALCAGSSPALAQLGPPPVPAGNPITEARRVLGKALFWDEQLSSDDTMACGTCHIPSQGGSDPRLGPGSIHPGGDGLVGTPDDERNSPGVRATLPGGSLFDHLLFGLAPQVTERHAPSTVGAAYFPELFWDGRADGTFVDPETGLVSLAAGAALENQAVGPILNEVEMADSGRTWDEVRAKLQRVRPLALAFDLPADLVPASGSDYAGLFEAAFGDPAITADRIGRALATYQRTLVPDQTPWDRFVAGDPTALTPQQAQGWNIFQNPGSRCAACHTPPLFSDGTFRNLGLQPIPQDPGREGVTGVPADRGRFKVPSLRGAAERGAFFHTGQENFATLTDVVNFYRAGGGPFGQNKDPLLAGINIPPNAVGPLVAFLQGGLTDPRMAAELPPFDRPRLNSERASPWPVVIGGATPGSGGFVPEVLPVSPAHLGAVGFRLGLSNALGGAQGLAVVALRPSGGGPLAQAPRARALPVLLSAGGPGEGIGTLVLDLPSDPALVGSTLAAQWFVRDPGATGGLARSDSIEAVMF